MTTSPVSADHLQMVMAKDGSSLLLDIERDRIVHLNGVATEMWRLLSKNVAESEIVSIISQKYQVDESRVATDLGCLLRKIEGLRLSAAGSVSVENLFRRPETGQQPSFPWYGDSGAGRPRPRKKTIVSAIVGLALFDLVLRIRSFRVLCAYINSWPLRARKSVDPDIKSKICSAVEQACIWYPRKAMCLQRSAITACLLRSHGFPAEMKIGIRPVPFMAHAWVELHDSVLNDWPGVRNLYTPILSY
jgi:hypothetical protein